MLMKKNSLASTVLLAAAALAAGGAKMFEIAGPGSVRRTNRPARSPNAPNNGLIPWAHARVAGIMAHNRAVDAKKRARRVRRLERDMAARSKA